MVCKHEFRQCDYCSPELVKEAERLRWKLSEKGLELGYCPGMGLHLYSLPAWDCQKRVCELLQEHPTLTQSLAYLEAITELVREALIDV